MEQITKAEERMKTLEELDTVVLASSKDSLEELAEQQETLEVKLLSDPDFANARAFKSFDDFEDVELHSTFLIDKQGRVHWSRIGGEPFTDFDYLEREIRRINRNPKGRVADADVTGAVEAGSDTRDDS
jgi:peroxiredoxin